MSARKCICGENLKEDAHGNAKFCCYQCSINYKIEKQRENNLLIKEFKSGFLKNYKLFCLLLPNAGIIKIPLHKLLNQGFDQDGFYGTIVDENKNQWHRVNEYAFATFLLKDQLIIYIHKN